MSLRSAYLLSATLAALSLLHPPAATAGPAEGAPAPPDQRPTVAVLYFDYGGPSEELAVLRKGLAQMLVTDLGAVEGARLVERDRLQEVLSELELGAAKKLDPATAAKVGRLLGARWLVMGGYFDLSGALRVDARVVEVETGRIVRSVGVTGTPGDFLGVEQQLATQLAAILASELPPIPPPAPEPAPEPAPAPEGKAADPAPGETPAAAAACRPQPPKALGTDTAVRFSKGLDAKDRGDRAAAKAEFEAVVAEQPDFALAAQELTALMQ
jgi:TolB-like protein